MLKVSAGVAAAAVVSVEHVCGGDAAWIGEADATDGIGHGSNIRASTGAVYKVRSSTTASTS